MGAYVMVAGLEQSAVTLLGSKCASALLKLTSPVDLVLTCCALAAILHGVPRGWAVAGRVSTITGRVLTTIALDTTLQWISKDTDTALACLNLMAVFFIGTALDPTQNIGVTAMYLLVSNLSRTLRGFHGGEALPIAWGLAFVPAHLVPPDVAELANLVTTDSFSAWLRDWFPQSLLMPSTVILLYLLAPFTEEFPSLTRIYRFAVFSFTSDTNLASTPAWLLACALWVLWQLEPDPVSRRLASVAGGNLAVLVVLDAARFAVDNDPAPTLLAILIAIRVLEAGK